jgi:hypothetical protein
MDFALIPLATGEFVSSESIKHPTELFVQCTARAIHHFHIKFRKIGNYLDAERGRWNRKPTRFRFSLPAPSVELSMACRQPLNRYLKNRPVRGQRLEPTRDVNTPPVHSIAVIAAVHGKSGCLDRNEEGHPRWTLRRRSFEFGDLPASTLGFIDANRR